MQWRALPLVFSTTGDDGAGLTVSSDAQDALLSMHAKNVGVVGLFGPAGSGKKLLLNTLLRPLNVDFSAVPDPKSNVLLWLWLPEDDELQIDDTVRLVLTSGAFNATEGDTTQQTQTLALLLLLSSVLLYNVDGEINADAAEGLKWLENVQKSLRIKAMQDEEAVASDFHEYAPKFVWLGRNFKVKWLKGPEGAKLTPNEYLEACLTPESGYGEAATKRNMMRMYLESLFPDRECIALSRAVEGNGTEAVPPATPRSELRAQFVETVDDIYANYLSNKAQQLQTKQLMGHELRTDQFVAMLSAYVDAMNVGELPTMQKASNAVLEQEITQGFDLAKHTYSAEIEAVTCCRTGGEAESVSTRELQVVHLRGLQMALAQIRELRSGIPDNFQKRLLKDLTLWEAQVKKDFQATLQINTMLSEEICSRILNRLLPQNLDDMTADLAARLREDFSDGLIRLLTQYKSDLRSALDEYSQQGSGPAVDECLEEALLQSVNTSIQHWGSTVLRQYQKHMRSWRDEKEELDKAVKLAEQQATDTTVSSNEHKSSQEKQLADVTHQLSELRRELHSELNGKKSELERLASEISTMNLKHDIRVKNAESDLSWARSRIEDLEKAIATERQQQQDTSSGTAMLALEKERSFRKEERSLLVQQKELMSQTVDLERQFLQKKTKHVQEVFALQNEHAKKVNSMKVEQAKFGRQLKAQAKKDLSSLKRAHEREEKALQMEDAALNEELAEIQQKLAVFAAEEEAARQSAAASRDFFKSMPMMPLPLMQAPAPAVGEEQRARRASKASTKVSSVSFDDTSTSSASPIARTEASHSNDMCRQS